VGVQRRARGLNGEKYMLNINTCILPSSHPHCGIQLWIKAIGQRTSPFLNGLAVIITTRRPTKLAPVRCRTNSMVVIP
jgi:hypothetical protein